MQFIPGKIAPLGVSDIEHHKYHSQFFEPGVLTVTAEESVGKVFFISRIIGSAVTIVNGGKTVIAGSVDAIFDHDPLRMSQDGFVISGTIDMVHGFFVPANV